MLQSFYDRVRDAFVRQVSERLREATTDDDLLRLARRVVYEHGGEAALADATGNTRTTEMATLSSSMIFDRTVLEGGDEREFRRVIREAGTEFRKQMSRPRSSACQAEKRHEPAPLIGPRLAARSCPSGAPD